jgi:hypothetical protein
MIRLEFSSAEDLFKFIQLIKTIDDDQIKVSIHELNKASDKLLDAEEKDSKNASTGSN